MEGPKQLFFSYLFTFLLTTRFFFATALSFLHYFGGLSCFLRRFHLLREKMYFINIKVHFNNSVWRLLVRPHPPPQHSLLHLTVTRAVLLQVKSYLFTFLLAARFIFTTTLLLHGLHHFSGLHRFLYWFCFLKHRTPYRYLFEKRAFFCYPLIFIKILPRHRALLNIKNHHPKTESLISTSFRITKI